MTENRMDSALRDVRIAGLKLENFKCFKQSVHLRGLSDFSCIVGPNGTGKSVLVSLRARICAGQVLSGLITHLVSLRRVKQSLSLLVVAARCCALAPLLPSSTKTSSRPGGALRSVNSEQEMQRGHDDWVPSHQSAVRGYTKLCAPVRVFA